MIMSWIDACSTLHAACKQKNGEFLPTRLIDTGFERYGDIRIVVTSALKQVQRFESDDSRYIALSYCWGLKDDKQGALHFATTPGTLDQYLHRIPIRFLPKTISDAIAFTRRLGIRYLWVDSLCILQGDSEEARRDWIRESPLMADVYGSAWLTIAASWGTSMHDGIFRSRSGDPSGCAKIGLKSIDDPTCKGTVTLVPKHDPPVDSTDEPLYRRAWALQERILSTRVLICNEDQFVWECQSCCFTESGFKMRGIGRMRLDREFLEDLEINDKAFISNWACIVTDYCHKSMTDPSDKLPAIAGLAKKFHMLRPRDIYLGGLWKDSLLHDLGWVHMTYDEPSTYGERCKPQEYRAPSWSWASVDGGVRWMFSEKNSENLQHARLLDCRVDTQGGDMFGMVRHAYITLEAPLWKLPEDLKALLLNTRTTTARRRSQHFGVHMYAQQWQSGIAVDAHWEDCSLAEVLGPAKVMGTDFYFLAIRDDISLILSSTKATEEGRDRCYERVGIHGDSFGRNHGRWRMEIRPCFISTICKLV